MHEIFSFIRFGFYRRPVHAEDPPERKERFHKAAYMLVKHNETVPRSDEST